MLKSAILYKEELAKRFAEVAHEDKYMYYHDGPHVLFFDALAKTTWNDLEFVSVHNDKVIGFLHAGVMRAPHFVDTIRTINFEKTNLIFSKDFYQFLSDLFNKYNFNKIEWTVAVGNPIEAMYDKLIAKYGGRVVGTRTKSIMLWDGKMYDKKMYEIFREEYLENK